MRQVLWFALAHVTNAETYTRAVAAHGLPRSMLARASCFPLPSQSSLAARLFSVHTQRRHIVSSTSHQTSKMPTRVPLIFVGHSAFMIAALARAVYAYRCTF